MKHNHWFKPSVNPVDRTERTCRLKGHADWWSVCTQPALHYICPVCAGNDLRLQSVAPHRTQQRLDVIDSKAQCQNVSFWSKLIFEVETMPSQKREAGTDRRADDFDGGGFTENGLHSAFSTTDGLDKLEQGCEEKQPVSHRASRTARFISAGNERNKCVLCVWCVCVSEDGGAGVFSSVCACVRFCLCDCEHEKCTACRNLLGGLCDDGTIKVSTVNTPV